MRTSSTKRSMKGSILLRKLAYVPPPSFKGLEVEEMEVGSTRPSLGVDEEEEVEVAAALPFLIRERASRAMASMRYSELILWLDFADLCTLKRVATRWASSCGSGWACVCVRNERGRS